MQNGIDFALRALAQLDRGGVTAAKFLEGAIDLLQELGRLYQRVTDFDRRQLNQAVFDRFYVDEGKATSVLQPPFAELVAVNRAGLETSEAETPSRRRAYHRRISVP